jgi:ABC-2 type transport system ATP-binding protein
VRARLIGTLSKGFRQRVGLGQAIVHEPPVLVLDEPTVGLDPIQIREIRSLIAELAAPEHGGRRQTVILSTHILNEVDAICQRVVVINRGSKVVDESLSSFKADGRSLEEVFVRATSSDEVRERELSGTPAGEGGST